VIDTSELELETWRECEEQLCFVHAKSEGTIEDAGAGVLQLDFANKLVGGGVLRNGCVQEEIRFLICPELIVSRLLAEQLCDHEALIVEGFDRFSDYSGYGHTFEHVGPHVDEQGHPKLVMIDAAEFGRAPAAKQRQFREEAIERELNKAYAGFVSEPSDLTPLCTGNWGCGAFGGDVHLKAIIQLLAASRAHRPAMHYLTFGDVDFARSMGALCAKLKRAKVSVGQLVQSLEESLAASAFRPRDLFAAIETASCAPVHTRTPDAFTHVTHEQHTDLDERSHHQLEPDSSSAPHNIPNAGTPSSKLPLHEEG